MTLAERIANTGEMDSIILLSNSLLSESLVPGYDNHLSSIPNITSERDVLTWYSNIFVDEASVYDKLDDLQNQLIALGNDFPELTRMSESELNSVISAAYAINTENNPAAIAPCTNPSCGGWSLAVSASSCLFAIAAAGWGYFGCMAVVGASTLLCCYS